MVIFVFYNLNNIFIDNSLFCDVLPCLEKVKHKGKITKKKFINMRLFNFIAFELLVRYLILFLLGISFSGEKNSIFRNQIYSFTTKLVESYGKIV